MRHALRMLACGASLLVAVTAAVAQSAAWPSKPLTLVVPFPAGGTSDVMGRLVATELEKALGQPIKVENIGGGGGVKGTLEALKRPADGYTLIQSGIGQNAVAHALDANVGYDSSRDFIHLTQVHEGANVLVVKPDSPYQSVKELVAAAKTGPGVTYGYTPAASGHMAMELMIQMQRTCFAIGKGENLCTGGKFKGVSFSGGKPLLDAALKGGVDAIFINVDAAHRLIKDGKLKALAVSSKGRSNLLPDVPTMSEAGYLGFEAVSWSGISVAKGTPPAVVARLETELAKVMASAPVKKYMEPNGFTIPAQGSSVYSIYVSKETDRWTRLVRIAGIKL
ncbi:Bug family tripartite tricarboxylate transporter substrate binding protein [Ottowia pentelensis]|uniref:Bug family tripartite tricarboxylate transporter substrate binding protein n=1 Tax=Ottowia pentelensis TaxID=511108 RepID=A0ABV6PSX6_9BURK